MKLKTWAAAGVMGLSALIAATANAAEPDIVVGAPNSLTGGFGEGGRQVVLGLQIAVDQINAEGGIKSMGGAKLKLISVDTSSDNPSQAASVTRRLITQDKAVILVGAHTSAMTLSAQIEAEKGEVPLISTSYADQIVQRGFKYSFKLPPDTSHMAALGAKYLDSYTRDAGLKPIKRVAVYYATDAAGQVLGKTWINIAKQQGFEVVSSGSFPNNLTDPTPVIAPLLQTKPDALFLTSFTSDMIMVIRAMRKMGINIPVISAGSAVSVKSIGESLHNDANGYMGIVFWNSDMKVDGVSQFDALYKKLRPEEPYPAQEAGEGYAAGFLIKAALEKAATRDPKKIRDVLSSIDIPAILPGGRVKFDATGLNTAGAGILVGWRDGKLLTLWPKEYQSQTISAK